MGTSLSWQIFSYSTIKRRIRNWGQRACANAGTSARLSTSCTLKRIFLQHNFQSWKAFDIWSNKLKVCQSYLLWLENLCVFCPAGSQKQAQVQDSHLWEPHLLWPLWVSALWAPAPGDEMWQWVKFSFSCQRGVLERKWKPWIAASYFVSVENTVSNVSYL